VSPFARTVFGFVIGALAAAVLVTGCADRHKDVVPLPAVDTTAFEPSVRKAVDTARSAFDAIAASNPDDARLGQAYGELAMTYHAQDLVAPAEIAYKDAHLLAPRDPRWPYLLGHLYNDASRVPEATRAFESALDVAGSDAPILQSLGQVYLQQGEFDKAKALFDRLLKDPKSRAAALAGLGKVELAKREYAPAIAHLEEALKLSPDSTRLRQPLAMAYQGAGDRARAEENLRQFDTSGGEPLVDDPAADSLGDKVAASRVLLRRGQRLGKAGRFDLAEKAFRAAVAADPTDAEALANLGISLANLGRTDEAEKRLVEAVALDGNNAVARLSLGVVYDRQGRDAAAIEQYGAALRSDEGNAAARMYLADAMMRTGHAAEAADLYREALARTPGAGRTQYSLAMAEVRAGRYAEARKTLEEALASHPGAQLFENALARILATAPVASTRDGARALQLSKSLFEKTKSPEVGLTYAMALAETGNFAEATTLQQETIIAFERAKMEVPGGYLQRNLAHYQRREPSREGWPPDDPIFQPRAPAVRIAAETR